MRRPIVSLAALLLGLAAIYLVIVAVIGSRVASVLGEYEAMLIARDDVQVVRFEYSRGFFDGTLGYELNWRPLPGDEFYEIFSEVASISRDGVKLTGVFDVLHGPWLGREGFGLAKIDQQIQAPQQLRDALPQYPGQQPVLELASVLTFAGNLRSIFRAIDYDGRLVIDNESADLLLAGLSGSFETNSSLTRFSSSVRLDQARLLLPQDNVQLSMEGIQISGSAHIKAGDLLNSGLASLTGLQLDLALGDMGFAMDDGSDAANMQLSGLYVTVDLAEDESTALLGDSRFGFSRFALDLPQENLQLGLSDVALEGSTLRREDSVDNSGRMKVAQFSFNGETVGGMEMESSLRGINIDSYVAIENITGTLGAGEITDTQLEELMSALQQLSGDQISMNLDRLVFFLPSEEDISITLTLAYDGSPQIDWQSMEELLAAIRLESSLRVSMSAIERLMVTSSLTPEQQEQYQAVLQEVYQMPYFTVTGDIVSSSLVIRQGEVLVNGEPIMSVDELLPLVGQLGSGFGGPPGANLSATDFGEPLFEHLILQADFQPDPYSVELMAGGDQRASDFDFNCSGNINASQPDVTLSYTAGPYPLFIYAEAQADTTLVVLGPDGWHCDDDGYRILNPAVVIPAPQSGDYLIWVGTYAAQPDQATLYVSEVDPR